MTRKKPNKGGRPTKYLKKYETQEFVDEYFAVCIKGCEPEVYVKVLPDGTSFVTGTRKRVRLPSIEDLSSYMHVSRECLYEWGRTKPEFSDTLNKIEVEQKRWLFEGGLAGDYNSVIAKLILANNHKMSDKADTKATIEDKNGVLRQLFASANPHESNK